ncbi:lysozyme C-like [Cherax quadricarinatus]
MLTCSWLVVMAVIGTSKGKIFEKCELATLLESKHQMPRDQVKNWVCIAQYESTFNTEAVNHGNWDGSKDYGLFQLSNKFWCQDGNWQGKNVCKMSCTDLLDDSLTDDLACIQKIIKDTERWKGKGTGLTAWVAYVNKCENRDLNEYMSECWSGASNIINIKDESPQKPATQTENEKPVEAGEDYPIINLVRVPIGPGLHTPFSPVVYNSNQPLPRPTVVGNPLSHIYQVLYNKRK